MPSVRVALTAMHKLTLTPSMCFELWDGGYVQLVAVMPIKSAPETPHLLVMRFECVMPAPSKHPAYDMLWLYREWRSLDVVPFHHVRNRAHLVQVMGSLHRPPAEICGPRTFVVHEGIWWRNMRDPRALRNEQPEIFRECPVCATRVPQPIARDGRIPCPKCSALVHW